MDKRTIIALLLAVLILFLYQMYFVQKNGGVQKSQTKTKQVEEETPKSRTSTPDERQPIKLEKEVEQEKIIWPAKDIPVETPLFNVIITDIGGGIRSVKLKRYKERVKGNEGKEIIEDIMPYTYLPTISKRAGGKVIEDSIPFKPDRDHLIVKDRPGQVSFVGMLEDKTRIKKTYTFYPDKYCVDLEIIIESPDQQGNPIVDFAVISHKKGSSFNFKGPFVYNGRGIKQIDKIKEDINIGREFKYVGLDEGYFAFIYIPSENQVTPLTITKVGPGTPVLRFISDRKTFGGRLYFGPKQTDVLKGLNIKAEKIIDFGWFDIIAKPLVFILNLFNRVTHNYGIDIILLTILIKLLFHPLSVKSYKSMKEMQRLQPQILKLREKYKDDKQKLNQEMMALYKGRGVNPMGGCLPMLIQIPVFFALYKALSGAIELRHAPFFLWINDLSSPEDLFSFTVLGFSIPIRLLPLVMGISQVVQQKMTPTSVDPMQKKMMLLMPIVFTFLFWGFPSGLVLYWLVNNVISIGEQYYINKKVS